MQLRAVIYNPDTFPDELYQRALALLDEESSARIRRFYHRADACRTLIGKFLTRALLHERHVPMHAMSFAKTSAGKPYITSPSINPPIAYNISHDNALVALAFGEGTHNPPAYNIGVDVMKVRIPSRDTLTSFIHTVGDQLTDLEHRQLSAMLPQDERLKRFFWMWTTKEAYTKALGIGLGFDFRRVEFDVENNVVRVDGAIPVGWEFSKFLVKDEEDLYQGVVAEFKGDVETRVIPESETRQLLACHDAVSFISQMVDESKG